MEDRSEGSNVWVSGACLSLRRGVVSGSCGRKSFMYTEEVSVYLVLSYLATRASSPARHRLVVIRDILSVNHVVL